MRRYDFIMKSGFRICAVTASAFALASCTPPEIEIDAELVDGRHVITLTQDWGLVFSDKQTPCINRVNVYAERLNWYEGSFRPQPIWRFEVPPMDDCLRLGSFTLGEVPTGFVEGAPFPPIRPGRLYVVVWGIGMMGEAEIALP